MEGLNAGTDGQEIIDILKGILENTNKWLIFAETKNGVLLGINGLFLFKMFDYLDDLALDKSLLNIKMSWILLLIFAAAILIILKSFFQMILCLRTDHMLLMRILLMNLEFLFFMKILLIMKIQSYICGIFIIFTWM